MSFESVKQTLKKADKLDGGYIVYMSAEVYFEIVDFVDALEERRRAALHKVTTKQLLQILPGGRVA